MMAARNTRIFMGDHAAGGTSPNGQCGGATGVPVVCICHRTKSIPKPVSPNPANPIASRINW
jgi:hypothetical protein